MAAQVITAAQDGADSPSFSITVPNTPFAQIGDRAVVYIACSAVLTSDQAPTPAAWLRRSIRNGSGTSTLLMYEKGIVAGDLGTAYNWSLASGTVSWVLLVVRGMPATGWIGAAVFNADTRL